MIIDNVFNNQSSFLVIHHYLRPYLPISRTGFFTNGMYMPVLLLYCAYSTKNLVNAIYSASILSVKNLVKVLAVSTALTQLPTNICPNTA